MIIETSNAKLKQNLNPRRFGIHSVRTHIFGVPQSGKTSIAIHYARNFKNPLYIDFADLRNTRELIKQILLKTALVRKNDLLILDNIPRGFSSLLNVANIANIITISDFALESSVNVGKLAFKNMEILPLNFEEFISFDVQNLNLKELLERFIRFGNLPAMLGLRDVGKFEVKQKILNLILRENMDIFLTLMRFQSAPTSIFQLYNILKKEGKMSKDRLYYVISEFNARGILRFVPHCDKPKAPKKAYFFDFSVCSALSYERNFIATFENMVFLEILGRNITNRDSSDCTEIFYSDQITLIQGQIGYILMPFKSKEMIKESLKKIDFMGLKIVVITVDLNDEIAINGKKIPLISFINFALDYG